MDAEVTKLCTGPCGLPKRLSQFGRKSDSADGYSSRCRVCTQEANRRRYRATQKPIDMRIAFKRIPVPRVIGIAAVGHSGTVSRMVCHNIGCKFSGEDNLHVKGICVHCGQGARPPSYLPVKSPVENLARSR